MAYSEAQAPVTRIVGIAFVVLLHALLIYALVTGLAYRAIEVVRAPIETKIIEEAKPPSPEAPPPPPPQLAPPPAAFVPPPDVHVETPPPPPPKSTAIRVVTPPKPVAPAPVAPAPVAPAPPVAVPVRVMPRLDMQRSQQPEYPAASRRLGEQGTSVIEVLVGVDGRVLDAKLLQSSGYDRLDQAALAGVKTDYHFVPGTVDGKPQPMWFTFKFNWKLQ
jgi:periplasmic protein TonB